MLLMAIYTVQCEMQARLWDQRTSEAQQAWLRRELELAARPAQPQERTLPEMPTLRRLVSALGVMQR